MTFEMLGCKELAEKLRALPDNVARNMVGKALKKAAEPIIAEAVALCPIGEGPTAGTAAAGIHTNLSNQGDETSVTISNSPESYYMLMYQDGCVGPGERVQPARPFLREAFEQKAPEALLVLASELKESIETSTKV